MTFYGPEFSPNLEPETQEFGSPLYTSRASGFAAMAEDSMVGAYRWAAHAGHKGYLELFSPGERLTPDEWRKSLYYREGMKVTGNIGENIAKYEATLYDEKKKFEARIAAMPKGILSKTAQYGGAALGFLLNPINAVAAGATSSLLMGSKLIGTMGSLARAGAAGEIAAHAARGAIIGAAALTPDTLIRFRGEHYLDQNPSGLNALATIGMGGVLGGVGEALVGGIRVMRRPISAKSFYEAREISVEQMQNGKSVDIEPIVKAGYRAARETESPPIVPRETLERQRDSVFANHEDLRQRIKDQEAAVRRAREELPTAAEEAERLAEERMGRRLPLTEEEKLAEELKISAHEKERANLERLKGDLTTTKSELAHLEGIIATLDNKGMPLTGEELKAHAQKVQDWRGNITADEGQLQVFEEKAKEPMTPVEQDLALREEAVNSLRENKLLSPEHLEDIESIRGSEARFNRMERLIRAAADCLKVSD